MCALLCKCVDVCVLMPWHMSCINLKVSFTGCQKTFVIITLCFPLFSSGFLVLKEHFMEGCLTAGLPACLGDSLPKCKCKPLCRNVLVFYFPETEWAFWECVVVWFACWVSFYKCERQRERKNARTQCNVHSLQSLMLKSWIMRLCGFITNTHEHDFTHMLPFEYPLTQVFICVNFLNGPWTDFLPLLFLPLSLSLAALTYPRF